MKNFSPVIDKFYDEAIHIFITDEAFTFLDFCNRINKGEISAIKVAEPAIFLYLYSYKKQNKEIQVAKLPQGEIEFLMIVDKVVIKSKKIVRS